MRVNDCKFIGNLATDPETRETTSGLNRCKFTIAVNPFGKKGDPLFVPVVSFRKTAEYAQRYLEKGTPVYVSGELSIHGYRDEDSGEYKNFTSILASQIQGLRKSQKTLDA